MSIETDSEIIICYLQWKIQNFSHILLLKEGDRIASPIFISDEFQGTKLSLGLHFEKEEEDGVDEMRVGLYRENDCSGPDLFHVDLKLAFVCEDGSIREEKSTRDVLTGHFKTVCTNYIAIEKNKLLSHERENFLPEDTLTVQCSIQKAGSKGREDNTKLKHFYLQTVLKANRKSFDCRIENFSTLQPGTIKAFKGDFFEFGLVFETFGRQVRRNIIPRHDCIKYISCNTSIIDSNGKKENRGTDRYFAGDLAPKNELPSVLPFMSEVMENEDHYLPNDVLSLCFDIVLLTVEHSIWNLYSAKATKLQKDGNVAGPIQDYKSIYKDTSTSDINLVTPEGKIPVHKNVLSARSSEFRKMLGQDSKEKTIGEIAIENFDSETLERMLMFMYTAELKDMTFISASKLYQAANKYGIPSLKSSCSAFLKDDLSLSTVFEVLLLAEEHKDEHLKDIAYDYILQHEQVFRTLEWKNFFVNNRDSAELVLKMKVNPDKRSNRTFFL